MITNATRKLTVANALRAELRSWGNQQRRLSAARDALVRRSLAAGISKEEIHQSMGIARTTIDRIGKDNKNGEES